jgi:CRAL/TRIO domain
MTANKILFLPQPKLQFKFKAEVEGRGGDFKATVYCFGEEEGEVWALTRWLRARKYVLEDVVKMVEEATQCRADAKAANFYPDPKAALGCDMSVYYAQYPQLYSGFAKNGCPLFISKPGVLNVDAVECVTTLTGIVKFHWYIMMHDFGGRLREQKKTDPHFKKFECVCVLDLSHLTMSQLSQRALTIIKEQSAIDSLCFPETMNKMYIINGPRFFGATWSLIKGWLDPRTANKIEVISNRKTWEKTLLEYVDAEHLPSDYGGKGPNTQDTIEKEAFTGKLKRMHTEVLYLR